MRARKLGVLLLAAVTLTTAPWLLAQTPGHHAGAEHRYDPARVETLTGTVQEVLLRAGRGGATGLHLMLQVENADLLEVLVGPTFYVFPKGLEVAKGDVVTVTGSRFEVDGNALLMAREIAEGELSITLRDDRGVPAWRGQRPAAGGEAPTTCPCRQGG